MNRILTALIVSLLVSTVLISGTVVADEGPGAKDKPGRGGNGKTEGLSEMEDFRTGQKGKMEGEVGVKQLPDQLPEELGIIQLTDKLSGCKQPRFSPDGRKIAYMWDDSSNQEIWVMELAFAGGTVTVVDDYPVTDGEEQCAHLEGWSPDGKKILFRSWSESEEDYNRLWIAKADGSGVYQLKAGVGNDSCFGGSPSGAAQASYSPDGRKIVYTMGYRFWGNWIGKDIYVMDADGTDEVPLTHTLGECEHAPRWSPYGSKILYKKCYDNGNADLWVMDADGRNRHVVVAGVNANFYGWDRSGSWIVYENENLDSPSGYDRDIYKVRPDGSDITRLTPSDEYCEHTPIWGPDGTILYRSDELRVEDITGMSSTWVMDSNGDKKTMINPWGGMWHDWSPSGQWIVFQTCEPPSCDGDEQIFIMKNPLSKLRYSSSYPRLYPWWLRYVIGW
ncbi:TolB family protein [Chloroflexota bacterium]